MSDAAFAAVRARSFVPWPCSPSMDDDVRGIRIAAPAEVRFHPGRGDPLTGAFARIILCGAYHFDSTYLGLRERYLHRLVLVAVDAATHRAAIGTMIPPPSPVDEPPPLLTDEQLARRSTVGYFNPDLADALGLPAREAEYLAYATLGSYVSNVVRIRVRAIAREAT